MKVAVIVHRWFEQGAGWAFAPDAKPILLDVIAALDPHMKAGREGDFRVKMRGNRCLLGSIAHDAHCLDPKARERKSTIVRTVVLDRHPSEQQAVAILNQIRSVTPTHAGPDVRLLIDVPATVATDCPKPVENTQPLGGSRRKTWRTILILLTIAVSVLAFSVAFQQKPWDGPPKPEDLRPVAGKMATQLAGWGRTVQSKTPEGVIDEYFGFLCQKAIWGAPPDSKHPYVEFVKRLPPDRPLSKRLPADLAQAVEGRWTEGEVEESLRKLVAFLEGSRTESQDSSAAADSLKRVDRLMNYDAWRNQNRKPDELNRFAIAPEQPVLDYVERFRNTASADFATVTDLMRDRLAKWQVPLQEEATPFQVLHLFFTTLQRPDFLSACSRDDKGHAYWRFFDRLPEQATSLGWTCDGRDQLDEALRDLLQSLGETPGGKTTEGLIEAIARQMDYDEWAKSAGRKWYTDGLPQSQELKVFIDRFRQ